MGQAKELSGGDCYEAAAIYLMDTHQEATLVHGLPTLQRPPYQKFGHAWIEYPGPNGEMLVREVANGRHLEIPVSLYYALGQIDPAECKRYTLNDLRRWAVEAGHWGPWETDDGL
jgi:hypothetical protein